MRPTTDLPAMLAGVGTDPAETVAAGVEGVETGVGAIDVLGTTAATGAVVVLLAYQQLLALPCTGSPKTLLSHIALPANTFVTALVLVP
ncbi:hypothetical protein [Methylibium sp.]|uniref:hypothetical protein n=1 Tax=Methylibium sp. TaxID=2067992 RepID=UPI003D0E1831